MANCTDPLSRSIHRMNPQNLLEKIVQYKIHQSTYWKQHCFGLTAETLVDKAMELDHTGGTHGGSRRPTPFLCLALKMLEIQPDKDIVVEFIKNEDYKYVRVLGAFYMRLTGTNADVYLYLEPLYNDYRKIRQKLSDGKFTLTHVDEFVDALLTKGNCCDTSLPRIRTRWVLEACGTLEPRRSAIEDDFEEEEEDKEDARVQPMDIDEPKTRKKEHYYGRNPIKERERKHERHHRDRDHDRDREHDMNYARRRERDRGRERDGERDREQDYYCIRDDYSRDRYCENGEHRRRRGRDSASSRGHAEDDDLMEEAKKRKEKKEKKGDMNSPNPNDPDIMAMNKRRASIGLKPLK